MKFKHHFRGFTVFCSPRAYSDSAILRIASVAFMGFCAPRMHCDARESCASRMPCQKSPAASPSLLSASMAFRNAWLLAAALFSALAPLVACAENADSRKIGHDARPDGEERLHDAGRAAIPSGFNAAELRERVDHTETGDNREAGGELERGDGVAARARSVNELSRDGLHREAALLCRRFAAESATDLAASSWYLAGAQEYLEAGELVRMGKLLDKAEGIIGSSEERIDDMPLKLLCGENAMARRDWRLAQYYFGSALDGADPGEGDAPDATVKEFTSRRLAAALALSGAAGDARAALDGVPGNSAALEAIDGFSASSRKSPALGGALGLIPGMGYAYSGEWGNAARSLILNGLFIWGMCSTADREDWGAFGVITFFELTWYTGSVYGGIDAAQRRNREAEDRAASSIAAPSPDAPESSRAVILGLLSLPF